MTEPRADPEHDAACASSARHQVIIAPPGTGKTAVSVRLADTLVPALPAHARVLLLTFSNQARIQLEREAVRRVSPASRARIEITNYHRFFLYGVRAYRQALGLPQHLDIGSSDRRRRALRAEDENEVAHQAKLTDSLAEHAFPPFRDERTPDPELLTALLRVIANELHAGRLVFDDLGALFWRLLDRFPSVEDAYRRRYPVVIADEHQDASALQDAVIRRLASARLTVLADPMQLIHGFRGASLERLERHRSDCDEEISLSTPHRWHGDTELAEWLVAVRRRLSGESQPGERPNRVQIVRTNPTHGLGAVKAKTKAAIRGSLDAGLTRIAVIVHTNQDARNLRNYLAREQLRPMQLGGSEDFEEARSDIEQLPLLTDPRTVALHGLERLETLVPALPSTVLTQVRARLTDHGIRTAGAGEDARCLLTAFELLYQGGGAKYFEAMATALDALVARGLHLPRVEAVRTLRHTARQLSGSDVAVDDAVAAYCDQIVAATHRAPRFQDGVFVMTAHQAKGKEFDTVILANALERCYPDTGEGRRLFYVAITRASSSWVVIAPTTTGTPLISSLG